MRRFLSKNISNEFFLGLILFTLPISININSIIIIIAISFFLYKNIKENSCINLKFFLPSFLFFLIQILSFYLSTNYDESVKKLTLFLPFLLFPLCFSPYLKDKNINVFRLFNYLLFGVFFIVIYGGFRFVFDIIFLNEKYNYGHGINLFMKYQNINFYMRLLSKRDAERKASNPNRPGRRITSTASSTRSWKAVTIRSRGGQNISRAAACSTLTRSSFRSTSRI